MCMYARGIDFAFIYDVLITSWSCPDSKVFLFIRIYILKSDIQFVFANFFV